MCLSEGCGTTACQIVILFTGYCTHEDRKQFTDHYHFIVCYICRLRRGELNDLNGYLA